MTAFFGQFGKVNRLRMSRSKKTTKSRGFAFIEFEHKEVAEVVADTMDNYLLYGRLMKCNIVPADKVHADTFRNSNRRMRNVPRGKIAAIKHNEQYTDADNVKKLQQSLIKGDGKKRKQLAAMGIGTGQHAAPHAARVQLCAAVCPLRHTAAPACLPYIDACRPPTHPPACGVNARLMKNQLHPILLRYRVWSLVRSRMITSQECIVHSEASAYPPPPLTPPSLPRLDHRRRGWNLPAPRWPAY